MRTQEVAIKFTPLRVILKPDAEVLQEVVVTGMQKMDKRLFTGAADQLAAANVKIDGMPEISRALEGRSAGVSVQNVSGTFGTAPKIRVPESLVFCLHTFEELVDAHISVYLIGFGDKEASHSDRCISHFCLKCGIE